MKTYKFTKQITINGKRKVFRADSQRELNKKILAYQGEQKKGKNFSDVAEEWKEEHWKHLAFNSTKNYNGAFKRIINEFSNKLIKDIEPLDIDRYLKKMAAQQFAKKTISNTRCVLNMIFTHAVIQGYIKYNPCTCISVTQGKPTERRKALTQQEIDTIIANKDIEFGLYPYFLLLTGMRPSEPLALTGADIDLKKMTITVNKSVYWDNHSQPQIKKPKTEAGNRKCVIPESLKSHLNIKSNELLFGIDKKIMTKVQYDNLWEAYRKQTGLKVTPYQLRHTYSTICKKAGVSVKDAQHLMGHANYATTMDIYTHYDDEAFTLNKSLLDEYIHSKYTPTV